MPPPDRLVISRRRLLVVGAGGLVAVACGGGGGAQQAATTTTTAGTGGGLTLARVFSPRQPAGVEVRLPLALADAEGALVDDVPEEMSVRIGPATTGELGDPIVVRRHGEGIPQPYFPLVTTFPEPGEWGIAAEVAGGTAGTLVSALAPSELPAVPVVGEQLISVPTPTVDDPRGVDPLCTAVPPCPLHTTSLDTAIGGDRAIALLIATPAFCQTAVCGPVLDLLVARQADFADTVTMVHAEVYTDDSASQTTDTVMAYGLTWEPSLFLARPDGTITSRLDYTYDSTELDRALSQLVQ